MASPVASDDGGDSERSAYNAVLAASIKGWTEDPVFSPYFHNTGVIFSASRPESYQRILDEEVSHQRELFTLLETAEEFRATMPPGVLTGDFPQWRGFYKSSGSGWAHARKALVSAYNEAKRLGVVFITGTTEGEVKSLIMESDDVCGAETADGRRHLASRTILTAGASVARFIDVENQIRPTAWTLGHIQMTQDEATLYKDLPVMFNVDRGFFMEPDEDLRQLKICDEHPGYCHWVMLKGTKYPFSVPFAKNQVPLQSEQRMRRFLKETMPHLADRPLVHARLCWCADTHDRQFIITRHPRHPSLTVATGDTGLGFMQIPSIGGFISDCMESKLEHRLAKLWKWRPETVPEFWGHDPLNRSGEDNKIIDLEEAGDEGWTAIA